MLPWRVRVCLLAKVTTLCWQRRQGVPKACPVGAARQCRVKVCRVHMTLGHCRPGRLFCFVFVVCPQPAWDRCQACPAPSFFYFYCFCLCLSLSSTVKLTAVCRISRHFIICFFSAALAKSFSQSFTECLSLSLFWWPDLVLQHILGSCPNWNEHFVYQCEWRGKMRLKVQSIL